MLFWVNLSTDLLKVDRIAFFGENVYILYVAEMAEDCMFLLFFGVLKGRKTLDYQINTSMNRHSAQD